MGNEKEYWDVQNIRNTFSKGIVAVGKDTVTAIYLFKDRWFTQSIGSNDKDILLWLTDHSDKVVISIEPERFIQFSFKGDFNIDNMEIFSPVTNEVSSEELKNMLDELKSNTPDDLIEIFKDVDFSNNEDVKTAFEKLDKIRNPLGKNPVEIKTVRNMNNLIEIAGNLPVSQDYFIEVNTPENSDDSGYLEFNIDCNEIVISNYYKELAAELIQYSSEITLEGDVNSGMLNIVVFA